MVTTQEFFGPWEGDVLGNWDGALRSIDELISLAGSRTLAWRGHANADWRLHSSLYRLLYDAEIGKGNSAPDESKLLAFESRVADFARGKWRFDDIPYLHLLAQLQHFRAPTRMIDVSLSPLVALWFAVERQAGTDDLSDGRLFAFDVTRRETRLTPRWSKYDMPWREDSQTKWCRELPVFWRPPSYNERIPAQQSGFLLAGVPKIYAGKNAQYRTGPGSSGKFWRVGEIRSVTSVPTRMVAANRAVQVDTEPTFTLRIAASAKVEIRDRLENHFGISASTMYPDPYGMAFEVRKEILDGALTP